MSRSGKQKSSPPVGWVYLPEGYTIRWQRGEDVAYVFAGKQMQTYPGESNNVPVLATIPVSSSGWTDVADIRAAGQRWLRTRAA